MKRFLLILSLLAGTARAELLRENFEGIRPLGMGNAFLAVADDSNVLWYNPAGLADVKGVHFNLIDGTLGVDSLDTFRRVSAALTQGDLNNLMRPDTEFVGLGIRTGVIAPYFGFQLFDS